MEQYLKEKYGKEFVVESIGYFHQYLGATTEIKGIVHPVDDKKVIFDVRKIADPNEGQYEGIYWENYFYALWEKQFNERVKHVINNNVTKVSISAPLLDIEKEVKGRTISLEDATTIYKGRISAYATCGMFKKADENYLSEKEAQNVFSFIKALQDKKFEKIGIKIIYFNVDYKEKIERNLHDYLRGDFSDYKRMKKKILRCFKSKLRILIVLSNLIIFRILQRSISNKKIIKRVWC